jgi:trigger factor
MKIDVKKEENNVAKLEIEIPAKDAVIEYNKAVKQFSEYVNIPGFRKGKAPRNIVEKHVGVDRIKHEALENLLPKVLQNAIIENKLDVISQPYVESYDFEIGQDVKLTAKVELKPEVTLGDYKSLEVEVEEYIAEDEALDKAVESLLQRNATTSLVVDRKTKATDIVTIDFDGSVNGEKIQGGMGENYPLDLANSNFIPGFAEQIVGHKLDEEFDINVEFPKEYHETKLAGQPAVFKIKLKEIKEKVLPELNDEFAQKVGPFKNVDELKADIQGYLDKTKEAEDKKKAENTMFEKVLNNAKVDIQDSMIEREAKALFEDYKQRISSQGYNFEDAVKAQGEENLMKELKEEATSRIKNSLVIDKIAQAETIQIDPADLEAKITELETVYHTSKAEILKHLTLRQKKNY